MMRRRAMVGLAVLATLTACTGSPVNTANPGATASQGANATTAGQRATIQGSVKLPSTMVAAGAMNLVAAGSMNLVAAGSMNLIAAGGMNLVAAGSMNLVAAGSMNLVAAGSMNYDLLGINSETRGGVVVFLCDALGRPIPGLPPVVTDANGRYTIPNVPAGFTLAVNALVPYEGNKRGLLATLVNTGVEGGADVDAGTTITSIRACSGRPNADLGKFDPAKFRQASDAALEGLTEATTPDFRDLWQVAAGAGKLEQDVAGLRDRLPPLREELATNPTSIDELHRQVGAPAPAPVTVVLPTTAPTAAASATPTPAPTPAAVIEACGKPVLHKFTMSAQGGTHLLFRIRRQGVENRLDWDIYTRVPVNADGSTSASVPEDCDFRVELVNLAGQIVAYNDRWAVPVNSKDPVALPF